MTIQKNIPLSKYTSLHVGGPARYLAAVKNDEEVREAVQFAHEKQLPFFVLGKGSNTIFSDVGYAGVVILMQDRTITVEGNKLTAAAGVFMRPLVNKALEHGLRGLEELAGIPGTIGGAVRGNAGTWNTEIKDVIESIELLMPASDSTSPYLRRGRPPSWRAGEVPYEVTKLSTSACNFSYRHSIFKHHPDWIILRATFNLRLGDAEEGKRIVAKDLADRHTKQPYDAPSAGSIFKNPDKANKIFSGKLIEDVGLKGLTIGGAKISDKHGNFIVNTGTATSADVLALIKKIQAEVLAKHHVKLDPEVEIV